MVCSRHTRSQCARRVAFVPPVREYPTSHFHPGWSSSHRMRSGWPLSICPCWTLVRISCLAVECSRSRQLAPVACREGRAPAAGHLCHLFTRDARSAPVQRWTENHANRAECVRIFFCRHVLGPPGTERPRGPSQCACAR